MGIVFYQNSFIGELSWQSRFYGYDFQKFSRFMGILEKFVRIYGHTFEKFLQTYGWYFYDLNDTTAYPGDSSYPPPPPPPPPLISYGIFLQQSDFAKSVARVLQGTAPLVNFGFCSYTGAVFFLLTTTFLLRLCLERLFRFQG